jgi:hypothetical protein
VLLSGLIYKTRQARMVQRRNFFDPVLSHDLAVYARFDKRWVALPGTAASMCHAHLRAGGLLVFNGRGLQSLASFTTRL